MFLYMEIKEMKCFCLSKTYLFTRSFTEEKVIYTLGKYVLFICQDNSCTIVIPSEETNVPFHITAMHSLHEFFQDSTLENCSNTYMFFFSFKCKL